MANSCNSATYMESQCVIQPRRLKDFLQDQNLPFPRSRSCSRKSTISVFFHAAVSSVKSSSILRRSISRRFSKSTRINRNKSSSGLPEPTMARTTSVTVKDILRWRSFRDLADPEENNVPLPSEVIVESDSPSRCTTTTATTTSAGTPRSSWCDSDFTVGDSPVWCRGFSGDIEKNFHINVAGGERLRQNSRDPKNQIVHEEEEEEEEEEEQFSPISVLDFSQEHEETFSSFHQVLANVERRNMMLKQRIQDFENLIEVEDRCLVNRNIELDDVESFRVEEKAIQLMDHVKTTSSIEECDESVDDLLLDFFRDELITNKGVKNNSEFESKVIRMAKCWVRGEDDGSLEWEMEGRREVCIQEMDKRGEWKDFEEEQKEIGIEIAKFLFDNLLNELSMDVLNV
ncbi:unnamed protein product [Lactuca virosa]|uniref:DUF4378 domain-containing protein n=1 Tax=Lactuca virosa TaxID=75947 RepID=A0AAU9NZW2_9ASTR|nr:unnamed protein product [Lactuca virosa]